MKKKIEWLANEREIPLCGIVAKGDTIEVDSNKAKSYIDEGLAQEVRPTKTKSVEKIEEKV